MTRCLDCGAPRNADQCASCGLTSDAAELLFRRKLIKRTVVFLAGSLAFPYVCQVYPPLDLDLMLVFFGILFFVGLTFAVFLDLRARKHQEIEVLKRIFSGFVPIPLILSATLIVNGRLDSFKNITYYPTTVVNRYYMNGMVRGTRRLLVRSWRPGQHIERLPVDADDFDRFRVGDEIDVGIEPGALGIPWVYGVYRRGSPSELDGD
jgi:hypothetical protein